MLVTIVRIYTIEGQWYKFWEKTEGSYTIHVVLPLGAAYPVQSVVSVILSESLSLSPSLPLIFLLLSPFFLLSPGY